MEDLFRFRHLHLLLFNFGWKRRANIKVYIKRTTIFSKEYPKKDAKEDRLNLINKGARTIGIKLKIKLVELNLSLSRLRAMKVMNKK